MIWNTVIDKVFDSLNTFLQFGSNLTIFQTLGNYIQDVLEMWVGTFSILQNVFQMVFFFFPVLNVSPLFLIIVVLLGIRIVISILRLITELIPLY